MKREQFYPLRKGGPLGRVSSSTPLGHAESCKLDVYGHELLRRFPSGAHVPWSLSPVSGEWVNRPCYKKIEKGIAWRAIKENTDLLFTDGLTWVGRDEADGAEAEPSGRGLSNKTTSRMYSDSQPTSRVGGSSPTAELTLRGKLIQQVYGWACGLRTQAPDSSLMLFPGLLFVAFPLV